MKKPCLGEYLNVGKYFLCGSGYSELEPEGHIWGSINPKQVNVAVFYNFILKAIFFKYEFSNMKKIFFKILNAHPELFFHCDSWFSNKKGAWDQLKTKNLFKAILSKLQDMGCQCLDQR